MASPLMNALRLIAAAIMGYAVAYMWLSIRPEDDITVVAGVGVVSAIIIYILLYMFGKGGGGS